MLELPKGRHYNNSLHSDRIKWFLVGFNPFLRRYFPWHAYFTCSFNNTDSSICSLPSTYLIAYGGQDSKLNHQQQSSTLIGISPSIRKLFSDLYTVIAILNYHSLANFVSFSPSDHMKCLLFSTVCLQASHFKRILVSYLLTKHTKVKWGEIYIICPYIRHIAPCCQHRIWLKL